MTTSEQLAIHPDRDRAELVQGVLQVSGPPGGTHGQVAARLAYRLHGHVEAARIGTILVEAGFLLARAPDTVRGPDLSFVDARRLDPEAVPDGFLPLAPDLAIEIASPTDRAGAIREKVADYLAAGTRMVWVIDPAAGQVEVHHPGRPLEIVSLEGTLKGEGVLPGFACPVRTILGR